jgi:predicted dehydrogenase/threonine dehydrogenase-like Zn-dependent dehydrogenase
MIQAILEDVRSGQVDTYEVPPPELRPGGILVRTSFSAISAGTERAHHDEAQKSLVNRALSRPDLVRQVVDCARTEGLKAAYQKVQSRLGTLAPIGYSCSGLVTAVGEGMNEFRPGDRVACGGVGYATHSEINFVPKNLAARVPDSVPLDAASLTTLGAIALQGFRQSHAVLGETVAVIGAGLVGALTIQLAKAAGCRVMAIDVDPCRAQRAKGLGADLTVCSTDDQISSTVRQLAPAGADVAIITASTPSSEPIELAANILRDRGRIVVVGDVALSVSRQPMYRKELSVALSRSYGPGRYDPQYEEHGIDYPIGYVRWTEKRNMEAFLELLSSGSINVTPLVGERCPVERSATAYEQLKKNGAYTVLVEYPEARAEKASSAAGTSLQIPAPKNGALKVGCIGAGGFARGIIFPALQKVGGVSLHSVATASGVASESARRMFHFAKALSVEELLQDAETEALIILSRHDSHARYVLAGLSRHKPVLVEKPLATDREQLNEIRRVYKAEEENSRAPFLMVGFNRRFAPFTEELHRFFANRREPMVVHARVNAGFIPLDHWSQTKSEGGRIVGEMCHFVDWARAVVGEPIVAVTANGLPDGLRYNHDNVVATLSFRDGSIANLLYLANGDKSIPKEHFEVFCEGGVARIDDFCVMELTRGGKTRRTKSRRNKGHEREIQVTIEAMRAGRSAPIPFEELAEVTEASIAIRDAIITGQLASVPQTLPLASACEPTLQQSLAT